MSAGGAGYSKKARCAAIFCGSASSVDRMRRLDVTTSLEFHYDWSPRIARHLRVGKLPFRTTFSKVISRCVQCVSYNSFAAFTTVLIIGSTAIPVQTMPPRDAWAHSQP
jgi:hypothetical protein